VRTARKQSRNARMSYDYCLFLAFSGESVMLECRYSASSEDYLSSCKWEHTVEDDFVRAISVSQEVLNDIFDPPRSGINGMKT